MTATLPTSRPVHQGLCEADLLGLIADSLARITGATLPPVADPVHRGFGTLTTLGIIADNLQLAAS